MKKERDCIRASATHTLDLSKSLMVSIGVSNLGQTQLIFVDPAVKINGAYYRDLLLTQQLLPVVQEISGDFILQQDVFSSRRKTSRMSASKHSTSTL